jgi:DNA modification methylase
MSVRIIQGDCRDVLKTLPSESVHCVVTSPPYWGLRDYGVAGQIGLEQSPGAYIEEMVVVFRDVWRVLRDDGTLWLNLGDSYAGSGRGGNPTEASSTLQGGQASQIASMVRRTRPADEIGASARDAAVTNIGRRATRPGNSDKNGGVSNCDGRGPVNGYKPNNGYKPKDLMGMPWRVAFALQADGWWLRQDIIWSKPNPMPESVTDRCTKAHEYLFLLSKSERYYYDADAIREPLAEKTFSSFGFNHRPQGNDALGKVKSDNWGKSVAERKPKLDANGGIAGANKRSVWTVATTPFSEAHFATFPPALIKDCILAGCPKGGIVLDPFGGAGTTGLVADNHGRDAILIELNPEYVAMANRRIHGPLFAARSNGDSSVPETSPESSTEISKPAKQETML